MSASPSPSSPPPDLTDLRAAIRDRHLADEAAVLSELAAGTGLSVQARRAISDDATALVEQVRGSSQPTMMESFLAEYGLSSTEGVALMCLAEALLRVPDPETIEELIEDKVVRGRWAEHRGRSSSMLVNTSTWALMLTGAVLSPAEERGLVGTLHGLAKRLGEPVVRTAVGQAMRELGRQFVLGETIEQAMDHARGMERKGYAYSYDMLGEAARTDVDARHYHLAYSDAITAISKRCGGDIRANPGISVKLSALHPRYEYGQRERCLDDLVARTRSLALLAKSAGMGFNIDAEEADRLDLSLDVIEAVLADPSLKGWDGFGVVVQAYGLRAAPVLDWLHALASRLDRRIMVRLVKGAYWDSEVKRAQVLGLDGFPVFTRKANTDLSYIACAAKLLGMTDRIYPQFATHNAHTVSAVLHLATAGGIDKGAFEFQRLHGMGEALHDAVLARDGTRCRIYAPVGEHRDLLAYLVRRLLENGANSSFVHQIVNHAVPAAEIARDPIATVESYGDDPVNRAIAHPAAIFGPGRRNARGWDLTDPVEVDRLDAARRRFRRHRWQAGPMVAGESPEGVSRDLRNPADPEDVVGTVEEATAAHVTAALAAAQQGFADWSARPVGERAACLERLADLYEDNAPELFALACREAGKSLADGVAEVREAVDFLRFYANEARRYEAEEPGRPRGVFACISPWNFPLAIFTGQIAAALAAGNAVVAKPAEQTPLIAARAVDLMRDAGVPAAAIQLLPGDGPTVGAPLVSDPRTAGVCFTGSTETARRIDRAMAENLAPDVPLIAETGGLNAMIVDSTALAEQAVRDIVASAFQSAGQRCSALRVLYVQKDVRDRVLDMLYGAMDALSVGDPWNLATDVGPVIDAEAQDDITGYVRRMAAGGHLLKSVPAPATGRFVAPAVLAVDGIEAVEREVFGPILHVASFEAERIDEVINAINGRGYGLTFGLHTRMDSRVQHVVDRMRVGNLYVNRNQIGAVVGSQPFGGEGLSGTGPKAGGPNYLRRFRRRNGDADGFVRGTESAAAPIVADRLHKLRIELPQTAWRVEADRPGRLHGLLAGSTVTAALEAAAAISLEPADLPGPTGESNRLRLAPRGTVLCLADTAEDALALAVQSLVPGGSAVIAAPGAEAAVAPLRTAGIPIAGIDATLADDPGDLGGFAAVAAVLPEARLRGVRRACAAAGGPILPLITDPLTPHRYLLERHLCVDTTAAGGNASLLAAADG